MYREMLVQMDDEETSVAVLEDHRLVEIYLEQPVHSRLVGNIYKGRVINVLPGMQAAFVDIGLDRNSFLYVEDVIPPRDQAKNSKQARPSIDALVKEGQELIVQVAKEPLGGKGARVTTRITLPGRYVILMPGVDYVGISRRIESEAERNRLKKLTQEIKAPAMGLIVRTVAEGVSNEELARDFHNLANQWNRVVAKSERVPAPHLLHRDVELLDRILRDLFNTEVDRLTVNSREAHDRVMEMVEAMAPSLRSKVRLDNRDLFSVHNVYSQIQEALRRKVWLKCGGYLVIDQTEALTAIDVNTGKFVGSTNLSDTVLKTNLEAAVEIARQIRLRNTGGIIIIDFIDMEDLSHQEKVLKTLEDELKKDKTKTSIQGLTRLGLVELTRKKARQGLAKLLQKDCPYCEGSGKVLSAETISLRCKKQILSFAEFSLYPVLLVEANPAVAALVIGSGGAGLRHLEVCTGKQVVIKGVESLHLEEFHIKGIDLEQASGLSAPVQVGEVIMVKIEETHAANNQDGIARVNGFILDVAGAASLVGREIPVEIIKVLRTSAKARPLTAH
ncbi:MAG: Rne/Rng family ribonuclease [Bacillota bacterium]